MTVMSKDRYVSPYLLRPLRSYEQALRELERRTPRAPSPGEPVRERASDAAGSNDERVRTHGPGSEDR
jgi:hypothetical protein